MLWFCMRKEESVTKKGEMMEEEEEINFLIIQFSFYVVNILFNAPNHH